MKISRSFCLAVIILTVFAQFGACYPIGDRQGGEDLLVDNRGIGEQSGSVVNITQPGIYEVFLERNDLVLGMCTMKCNANFLVCFEGESANQTVLEECDTGCGFYVTTQNDSISFMQPITSENNGERKHDECDRFPMANGKISFRNIPFTSCKPKIENGTVILNVTIASSNCPVTVKDAHLKTDTTTAPPTTTTLEHASATKGGFGSGTTTAAPTTFMDDYWWTILIIVIVIVVAIIIGVVVYCVKCKKDKKSPDAAAAQQNIKESQSPVVQQSKPAGAQKDEKPQPSYLDVSSILSQKSLLKTKKEQAAQESTDLRSIKPDV